MDMSTPRRILTARIYPLGAEPGDDLSAMTTIAERLDCVAVLSERMWQLTGNPPAGYSRTEMPIRVLRPHE